MQKNLGSVDKVLRVIVGVGLVSQVFLGPVGPSLWGWIGVVPLATVLVNWCPAYALLGLKTCRQC